MAKNPQRWNYQLLVDSMMDLDLNYIDQAIREITSASIPEWERLSKHEQPDEIKMLNYAWNMTYVADTLRSKFPKYDMIADKHFYSTMLIAYFARKFWHEIEWENFREDRTLQ